MNAKTNNAVTVYFDVEELYYLPQYLPIRRILRLYGATTVFVLQGQQSNRVPRILLDEGVGIEEVRFVSSKSEALNLCIVDKPDWLILGNSFSGIDDLHPNTKTALVSHGIGPKSCYYTVSDTPTTVRFVEGPYRTARLQEMYPGQCFVDTGYAKLDPAVNGDLGGTKPSDYGLDDNKKTLLYAPTFYPSSIECFDHQFPLHFSEYNIILKPHFFSLSVSKYEKQKNILERWAKYPNVYLADVDESNILPFMVVADVLISDASSTLFEFAALNKPVVWCDFLKLRWTYRGIFSFRFRKRMDPDLYKYADIAAHAKSYRELKSVIQKQITHPDEFASQRSRYTLSLAGNVDGKASERIVQYILNYEEA
ncbi:CDP-glycerol glycerophosphotransferase family protein [Bermanella marisrubri]|uniref:CDP-glycerol:poly(Glycerophosphate) glycerophosphotransferase n=1 Tax=Bermanella marisrubri TaxID=207949 RepID=Q1N5C7_9GAMM|nr:CDP-glycerol glycerophosphotransferase family protein [Bermanella marisrubri]EAT13125.1 hypothetical protein RED65_00155 [Oceanobacter sp. RED65] [Bermanella marisrubri]